ncbi:MAG: hypothetical protein OXI69_15465 [Acidobacteriota bacterium]|nr:hypothetical protein [Acidobacteriota bacterium]
MSSFRKFETEHLRLAVLQILAEDSDYAHNELVLSSALGQLGHGVSSDQLRTELAWLAEQGLLAVQEVRDVQVVRLNLRGADVARGVAQVPGIARPRPKG